MLQSALRETLIPKTIDQKSGKGAARIVMNMKKSLGFLLYTDHTWTIYKTFSPLEKLYSGTESCHKGVHCVRAQTSAPALPWQRTCA